MNRDRMEGKWRQVTGQVKEYWGMLTGDPPVAVAGRRKQLAGRIQERRGISKQQAARQLRDFMCRNRDWYPSNR